jgi:hypothetical protein
VGVASVETTAEPAASVIRATEVPSTAVPIASAFSGCTFSAVGVAVAPPGKLQARTKTRKTTIAANFLYFIALSFCDVFPNFRVLEVRHNSTISTWLAQKNNRFDRGCFWSQANPLRRLST